MNELQLTEEQPMEEQQPTLHIPKNKQQIRLIFPYSENQEIKKLGAKWNSLNKLWYYPSIDGKLPEELRKYRAHKIFLDYDNKEYYKPILTSMRFDKLLRLWIVNQADYDRFISLG